ncbi:hypothetical protein, partial [Pseudophaeobacter sp.]|uniref:hypothetical protein n=1 Tax=Pseudophaeobacter sp. TaxID=1971739 RepID=UPI0026390046
AEPQRLQRAAALPADSGRDLGRDLGWDWRWSLAGRGALGPAVAQHRADPPRSAENNCDRKTHISPLFA